MLSSDIISTLHELRAHLTRPGCSLSSHLKITLEEYLRHFMMMQSTSILIHMFPEPRLSSLHLRRLFNIQWMTEQWYLIRLLLQHENPLYTHDFGLFEEALRESGAETVGMPPFFHEYKIGKFVHYETHCHERGHPSPMLDLKNLLGSCIEQVISGEGFHRYKSRQLPPDACIDHLHRHLRQIEEIMHIQTEILKRALA